MKRFKLSTAAIAAVALAAVLVTAVQAASGGSLGQLTFISCNSDPAADGCTNAVALDEPVDIALQNDESRLFAASHSGDAVAVFVRDRSKGTLKQLDGPKGCIREPAGPEGCAPGRAMNGVSGVSAVGDWVLWSAEFANAVGAARKDAETRNWAMPDGNGACVSNDGSNGCTNGHGLVAPTSILATNSTVYVGGDSTVAIINRSNVGGALSQSSGSGGCINNDGSDGCRQAYVPGPVTDFVLTKDLKYVYAAASGGGGDDGAVLVFERDASGGLDWAGCINETGSNGCADGYEMQNPTGVAVDFNSSGGVNVYAAANGSGAVDVFTRNTSSGLLSQHSCWNEAGTGGCGNGYNLSGAKRVNVYKTNKFVEVTAGDGVSIFNRDKKTGTLSQLPAPAQCTSDTGNGGSCLDGAGLQGATGIVSTGGGKHVYISGATSDAVSAYKLK